MNTFGNNFRLTTFGESHGPAIGGVIDGMPAGIRIDLDQVQAQLDRRRPGQNAYVTARREADRVRILSGLMPDGCTTTGTPIGFVIENTDARSADYAEMEHIYRPSHADYTYQARYGVRDHRGGGRASARETAARVVGGAFARQWLATLGISITAWMDQIGPERTEERMLALIQQIRSEGDSIGGYVGCRIDGLPAGVGSPVADKLSARLAGAMMSIPAAKGFELGMGFDGCLKRGSEMIDEFYTEADGTVRTHTNHSGGVQGGISNGMPVTMRVAFKPTATLGREVNTVTDSGEPTTLKARGRHDPCVVPRAVPVVEAMAAITVADLLLSQK